MTTRKRNGRAAGAAPVLEMVDIRKQFGDVHANAGVNLRVAPGEVHGLLGENGAGKSTLMHVLYGLVTPDAGTIRVRGETARIETPRDAIARGIGMVHQHFMLVDGLTVAENLIAGAEPVRYGLIDTKAAVERVQNVARRYGLRVDATARIEHLSVGEQQRVEILKALMHDADILVLDEPTAVLTPQEVDELFRVMQQLKRAGKSVIFITHKLKETMAFADRVTVLRDGVDVGTANVAETTPARLAELMVGRRLASPSPRTMTPRQAEPLLALHNVSATTASDEGRRGPRPAEAPLRLRSVNLEVHGGEILGIAGIEGNGQFELEQIIAGLRRPGAGTIRIAGQSVTDRGSQYRRRLGLAHIPSDRLRTGLVADLPVAENALLGRQWDAPYARRGVLRDGPIAGYVNRLLRRFDVRGAADTPAAALSGGNQQKLIIGRELSHDPRVILACQPTRGVDVGAVERIHDELLRMRARGKAILLISADLDELLTLSDRLAVMYEGAIVTTGPVDAYTETELGMWMAGTDATRQGGESA